MYFHNVKSVLLILTSWHERTFEQMIFICALLIFNILVRCAHIQFHGIEMLDSMSESTKVGRLFHQYLRSILSGIFIAIMCQM